MTKEYGNIPLLYVLTCMTFCKGLACIQTTISIGTIWYYDYEIRLAYTPLTKKEMACRDMYDFEI